MRCAPGAHVGPLSDTVRFNAAGGLWSGQGCCENCGSHVHRSQIVRPISEEQQTGRADLRILRSGVGELRAAIAQVERLVPEGGTR